MAEENSNKSAQNNEIVQAKGKERKFMKQSLILAAGLVQSIVSAGCMPAYYGQYGGEGVSEADTLQSPVMTKEDVIALSKEGIGNEVIISQIKATRSYFQLSTTDLLELKKAGVSEKVIGAMIASEELPRARRFTRRYYYPYLPFVPRSIYYGYPWYYPRYPSIHLGISHGYYPAYGHPGFYGGYFGRGHYSGFQGYGGHRSFGGHR